jgi:hypothetical protein
MTHVAARPIALNLIGLGVRVTGAELIHVPQHR